jgi:hypothetical protein
MFLVNNIQQVLEQSTSSSGVNCFGSFFLRISGQKRREEASVTTVSVVDIHLTVIVIIFVALFLFLLNEDAVYGSL